MRSFNSTYLDLLDEGREAVAGMIRFDLGEGSFGFIQRPSLYIYGGLTYQPVPAGIFSVSDLSGATGTAAHGFAIELSESGEDGLTPAVILNIEDYDYRDRPATIYDLKMHPDTGAVLGDPVPMKSGYINAIRHREDPSRGHIAVIECEGREIDYSRTNGRIRSDADQKRRTPGDRFLEHAGTAGRIKLNWGKE